MPIILREFDTTQPNIDFTDLSTTITVSGVRLLRDVTLKTLITDNISGEVDSASDFLENPYTSKLNVDILNQDGSVAYQNFLQDYKSNNFTFTEYDNINVFGEYEKDFGVQMKVVGNDDSEQTTRLFLYGNHPYISGIDVQDVSGAKRFSSSASAGSTISAIGQTGGITGVINFFNDPNYIVFDKLEVYSTKSSSEFVNLIDPQIVLSTPILESSPQFAFNIGENSFGFTDSSEFFLHFVTYGQFGTGDVWRTGPHNFVSTPVGSSELGLQSLQSVTDIGSTTSNEISLLNNLNMSNESAEINFLAGAARFSASSAEGGSLGGVRIRSDKFSFDVNTSSAENSNEVNSFASVALAGTKNKIYGDFDAIVVGTNNIISGQENAGAATGNANFNFIGAGSGIRIFESSFSSIVGGADNEINEDSENAFIGGGSGNKIAGSRNSIIVGGIGNVLQSSESVQIFGSHVDGDAGTYNGYIYLSDDDNRTKAPNRSDALFIDFNNGVDIKTGHLAVGEGITMSGGQPVATQSFVTSQGYVTGVSSSSVTSALGYIPVDPSTTGALVNDNDIANFITGINSSSVTSALGYTPVDPSTTGALVNDNDIANFITGISSSSVTSALGYTPVNPSTTGALVNDNDIANFITGISSSSVTSALGYTPVNPSTTGALVNDNDIANFITGISSSSVTSALGYTPVNPSTTGALVNDNDIANFITGISSSDVTDALGFTPISAQTDDQTLDEVLAQGNTSSRNITAGGVTGSNGVRGQDVQIGVTDSAMIDTSAGNLDIGSAGGTTILGDAKVSVTNKLGVGTASPLYPFALENSGTGLISRIYNTNADGDGVLIRAGSTSSATRALQVASTNDTKILTVNSNGRVGITTTSPDYLLDIGGDTASANNTIRMVQANNGTAIRIGAGGGSNDVNVLRVDGGTSVNKGESDSSNYGFSLRYKGSGSGANNSLAFFTDNSAAGSQIEALTILNDGKVGIGSTAPGCNLQVAAGTTIPVTTAPNGSISICSVSGTTTPTILGRQTANAVGMYLMAATANGNTAGDMVFNVRENNNSTFATTTNSAFRFQHFSTNLLSILRSGNVGIGTTSPSSLLHLASTGPAVLTIEADTDNATETDNARIVLKQDGAIVVGRMGYENNTNALEFINEFNDSLSLGTNNNKRFTITGSGNASFTGAVGINTSSPEQELHVYQGTAKFESTNGSDVSLQLGRSDVSNLWNFNHAGGDLRIYNAGGSGYDIMFGVNAGGGSSSNKVGINTASPSTALHVEGTITHKVYTVAALPSASPAGQRSFVSDASSVLDVNLGATVSAGGSNLVPVFSDGSNWIVG